MATRGGPVEVIRQGDTVWIPPGEEHWHGAAPDSFMTHTAISLGPTRWDAEVAETDYRPPLDGTEEQ